MEAEKSTYQGGVPPPYSPPDVQYGPPPNVHYGPPPNVNYGPPPGTVTVSPVTVIHTRPVTYMVPRMGAKSQSATCRVCNKEIVTQVRHNTVTKTHIVAGILCLLALWPCAIGTYFVNNFKSVDHYCPFCQTHLGTYNE